MRGAICVRSIEVASVSGNVRLHRHRPESPLATVLFENADHRCVVFNDLVRGDDGVQANQFLVQDGRDSALIDPGGALLYTPLSLALSAYMQPKDLTWIVASHQDPDIIGAVDRWLMYTEARVVCSKLWGRFVPHSVPHYQQSKAGQDRYLLLSGRGRSYTARQHLPARPARALPALGRQLQLLRPGQPHPVLRRRRLVAGFHRHALSRGQRLRRRMSKPWPASIAATWPPTTSPACGWRWSGSSTRG
jgi:hypothetical protein